MPYKFIYNSIAYNLCIDGGWEKGKNLPCIGEIFFNKTGSVPLQKETFLFYEGGGDSRVFRQAAHNRQGKGQVQLLPGLPTAYTVYQAGQLHAIGIDM